MKKSFYHLINGYVVIAALVLATSCTKLKETSYDSIIQSQFNATGQDLVSLVGACYVGWRTTFLEWNGIWRSQEVAADQVVIPARPNGWVDGGVYRRIHEHSWTSDEDNVVQGWQRTFSGITSCNRVIYQIESGGIPLAAAEKVSALAELKVLRASYYYLLCDLYGNVPIVSRYDVSAGFVPTQSTRKEVYDFIVKEITDNINSLSTDNNPKTYGHFNKWAAECLLAKMYLNAEVYSGTAQWQKCIDACDAIINSGAGYILEPSQKNVFKTDNAGSKEIIFALPLDDKYTKDWNQFDIHMQTLQPENQATYNLKSTPWGGMCAVPQSISSFDPDDSRLTDNFIRGQQYSSSGDKLICTMGNSTGKPLIYINELPGVDQSDEVHGFRFGKFEIANGANVQLSNDFPVFRYADVLMMKAECLLRLGNADAAAAIVTTVRQRAFKSAPEKATVTGADLLKGSNYDYGLRNHLQSTTEGGADIKYGRFLDELAWEFNQEGRRRTDMIRFGAFSTKSWLSHTADPDNHLALYPIPRVEMAKNANLKQNPGY